MTEAAGAAMPLREQQRAFTRERLVQAGAEVFSQKGYIASTVEDIVGAAGASRATFYLHFRTKADVLAELGSRLLPDVRDFYVELDEVLDTGTPDHLRDWMDRALRWMEGHRAVLAASDAAVLLEGPGDRSGTTALVELMPRWLARWPASARAQADIRIALLIAQFRAISTFQVGPGSSRVPQRDEVLDAMTDVWWAGLTPPASDG